jgi:hypothetical protein
MKPKPERTNDDDKKGVTLCLERERAPAVATPRLDERVRLLVSDVTLVALLAES